MGKSGRAQTHTRARAHTRTHADTHTHTHTRTLALSLARTHPPTCARTHSHAHARTHARNHARRQGHGIRAVCASTVRCNVVRRALVVWRMLRISCCVLRPPQIPVARRYTAWEAELQHVLIETAIAAQAAVFIPSGTSYRHGFPSGGQGAHAVQHWLACAGTRRACRARSSTSARSPAWPTPERTPKDPSVALMHGGATPKP